MEHTSEFDCDICKQHKTYTGIGTGYGRRDSLVVCYACCAALDRQEMIDKGRTTLYLTTKPNGDAEISNWPGTLKFTGRYSVGRHNIARKQYNVRFYGPDGAVWSGIQYGDNTQICHCRRTKLKRG